MYILSAVIVDLIIGDPDLYPHPVVLIGKMISWLEDKFRLLVTGKFGETVAGFMLVIIVVLTTFFATAAVVRLAYHLNYFLGLAVNVFLLSTTIAVRGLARAARKVYTALAGDNLELARDRLDLIVGRDTDNLGEEDIIRGTVETVAENTSDGVIAPLFYGMLGGVPLAMAYKAVNTLDSMLGYRDEKYYYFGRAAARIDDLVNWLPARITAVLFVVSAAITGRDWKSSLKIILRDAGKHPSLNAGYPEAAVAGALKLRLGGVNYYHGEESFRAYLGDAEAAFRPGNIMEILILMYWTTGLFLLIYSVYIYISTLGF